MGFKPGGTLDAVDVYMPLQLLKLSDETHTCQREGELLYMRSSNLVSSLASYTNFGSVKQLQNVITVKCAYMACGAHCMCKARARNLHFFSFFFSRLQVNLWTHKDRTWLAERTLVGTRHCDHQCWLVHGARARDRQIYSSGILRFWIFLRQIHQNSSRHTPKSGLHDTD